MRKFIFSFPILLALLFSTSCSSNKEADEPQAPAAEISDIDYSNPSYKTNKDISWLDGGIGYIDFIEPENNPTMLCMEHGVTSLTYIFDEYGRYTTFEFKDEIKNARIVGGWTSRNYTELTSIELEQPATEVEITRGGKFVASDKGISFDINGPSMFADGCTNYYVAIYLQGQKDGKDVRGLFIINVATKFVGNTTASEGQYFIANASTAGFSMDGGNLIVPTGGGKVSLRLDNRRKAYSISVSTGNERFKAYKSVDDFFSVNTPNAEYTLSEITSYLTIEFQPNITGKQLIEKVEVNYEPLEIELKEGCMYGFAYFTVIQQAQ